MPYAETAQEKSGSGSHLPLDLDSLDPEALSMGTLTRELTLRKRPAWVLRKLMSVLEARRIERKLGWSRPWNKIGMNVFRTHIHDLNADTDIFTGIGALLQREIPALPPECGREVFELLSGEGLMAFTFYHNSTHMGRQFEGLTISMGRKVLSDRTKRDRLDLILEDLRVDGTVDGRLDRVRVYANPWSSHRNDEHFFREWSSDAEPIPEAFQSLYERSVKSYQVWKDDPKRQWEHWSIRFIDYFGPRNFIPRGSLFT